MKKDLLNCIDKMITKSNFLSSDLVAVGKELSLEELQILTGMIADFTDAEDQLTPAEKAEFKEGLHDFYKAKIKGYEKVFRSIMEEKEKKDRNSEDPESILSEIGK